MDNYNDQNDPPRSDFYGFFKRISKSGLISFNSNVFPLIFNNNIPRTINCGIGISINCVQSITDQQANPTYKCDNDFRNKNREPICETNVHGTKDLRKCCARIMKHKVWTEFVDCFYDSERYKDTDELIEKISNSLLQLQEEREGIKHSRENVDRGASIVNFDNFIYEKCNVFLFRVTNCWYCYTNRDNHFENDDDQRNKFVVLKCGFHICLRHLNNFIQEIEIISSCKCDTEHTVHEFKKYAKFAIPHLVMHKIDRYHIRLDTITTQITQPTD